MSDGALSEGQHSAFVWKTNKKNSDKSPTFKTQQRKFCLEFFTGWYEESDYRLRLDNAEPPPSPLDVSVFLIVGEESACAPCTTTVRDQEFPIVWKTKKSLLSKIDPDFERKTFRFVIVVHDPVAPGQEHTGTEEVAAQTTTQSEELPASSAKLRKDLEQLLLSERACDVTLHVRGKEFGAQKCCKWTEEVAVQTTTESEELPTSSAKLLKDLERLLLSESACDVTLHVGGKEFGAHSAILRARSPVFACMLGHDMKEKKTGEIDIKDCDPENFSEFLSFLYCANVDGITSQNMCSLYRVADKYDVQDLKSKCLAYIRSHLDVDHFCDVITLALQHREKDLVKQATDFFVENSLEIVVTVKWQTFLTENPIQGNELTIKALSANKSSKP